LVESVVPEEGSWRHFYTFFFKDWLNHCSS
jgi:hypothetical protein